MQKLRHENIISLLEYGEGVYKSFSGKDKVCKYIVTELALGGNLFDFVKISGRFNEDLARYFFTQMIDGLEHCH